jgi:deoxyadenosine/deoxycytidine kinase
VPEFLHLVLAGNVGAGKTTLTTLLGERFGWRPYYERVDGNPFLADFYADMARWAFPLQLYFLTHRLEDLRRIAERQESAIQDRSIHEDAMVFARNLRAMGMLSAREWETYERLYRQLVALLRPPDLIVYLRCSVDGLMLNISQRGRDCEAAIERSYLARLNDYYEEWIASRPGGRLLLVEAEQLDFLGRPADLELLVGHVRAAFGQRELFGAQEAPPADPRFLLLAD